MSNRGGALGRKNYDGKTIRRPARARTYHDLVNWVRIRAVSIPPLLVDVALAIFLGTVGAAQLWSKRSPFDPDRERRIPGSLRRWR